MKAMKKVLALGLALAMVVTAVPVTNAEAASAKLPAKKTYYVGKTNTLKLNATKVKKTAWSKTGAAVKLSAKAKKSVKVTAVKAGTSTVKAKVTYTTGKSKTYSCKVTVKNPVITVPETVTVAVNSKESVAATKKAPSSATVAYKSADETIATVDAATGEVTGVKTGTVEITATLTCGTKTVDAKTTVTVKNVILESVKQTKADTLEAVITGDTKSVKEADITVTNTTTNVVYPVKKVSVDSKDATKVTLNVFAGLTDGKEYNVTLDGVTESFVATDGTVADVTVDKTTIPYATETTIKLVATDAKGIVLTEADYGTQDASKYDFSITTSNGYVLGSKLSLNKVGDTATAEVTYKTGKYGEDGKPVGNIGPKKITITAVEQAAVNNYDVRIGKTADGKYDKAKDTKTIAVGEGTDNVAYFMIKDADSNEVKNYYDYSVESSDTSVLMVQGTTTLDTKSVTLVPVKAGTSYLLLKKNNAIVYSFAITVVAERAVATMTIDKTSVSVSNAIDQPAKITASFKDQYSDDFGVTTGVKVTCLSTTAKDIKVDTVNANLANAYFTNATYNNGKAEVSFKSNGVTEGTYQYKISYEKDGKEICARTVVINVQKPGEAGKATVSFALNMGETSVDAVVDSNYSVDKSFSISVAELLSNVVKQDALDVDDKLNDNAAEDKKTTVKSIDYVIKKGNDTVIDTAKSVTSGAGITVGSDSVITVDVTKTGDDSVVARMAAGTYTVTATIKTLAAGKTDVLANYGTATISNSFVITDTTPSGTVSLENDQVTAGTIGTMVAGAIKYTYGEKSYGANADNTLTIVSVEGTSNGTTVKIDKDNYATANLTAGQIVNVTKVVVTVDVKDGVKVTQEITTPFKITAK